MFAFAGDLPYSVEAQRHMFEHIAERNAIVREVAQAAGCVSSISPRVLTLRRSPIFARFFRHAALAAARLPKNCCRSLCWH